MASRCYTPAPASTCRPLRTADGLCFVHRAKPGTTDIDIACPCMYGALVAPVVREPQSLKVSR